MDVAEDKKKQRPRLWNYKRFDANQKKKSEDSPFQMRETNYGTHLVYLCSRKQVIKSMLCTDIFKYDFETPPLLFSRLPTDRHTCIPYPITLANKFPYSWCSRSLFPLCIISTVCILAWRLFIQSINFAVAKSPSPDQALHSPSSFLELVSTSVEPVHHHCSWIPFNWPVVVLPSLMYTKITHVAQERGTTEREDAFEREKHKRSLTGYVLWGVESGGIES